MTASHLQSETLRILILTLILFFLWHPYERSVMSIATWDELLCEVGKVIEDAGRMMRGKGRKKPKVYTLENLEHLRDILQIGADCISMQIAALDEYRTDEEKDKADRQMTGLLDRAQ